MENTTHEPTARIHYSTKTGTKKLTVSDLNGQLEETIKEIEQAGGIVLRVSRVD